MNMDLWKLDLWNDAENVQSTKSSVASRVIDPEHLDTSFQIIFYHILYKIVKCRI